MCFIFDSILFHCRCFSGSILIFNPAFPRQCSGSALHETNTVTKRSSYSRWLMMTSKDVTKTWASVTVWKSLVSFNPTPQEHVQSFVPVAELNMSETRNNEIQISTSNIYIQQTVLRETESPPGVKRCSGVSASLTEVLTYCTNDQRLDHDVVWMNVSSRCRVKRPQVFGYFPVLIWKPWYVTSRLRRTNKCVIYQTL